MASSLACSLLLAVHSFAIAYLVVCQLVRSSDVLFVFLSSTYALAANTVSQKTPGTPPRQSMLPRPSLIRLFFPFTVILSLVGPWYCFAVDNNAAAISASHLFLVHSQLAVETWAYWLAPGVSSYVRVGLPILYVSYRLPVMLQWVQASSALVHFPLVRILALANVAFWAFGLFGFLLPYVLTANFNPPPLVD